MANPKRNLTVQYDDAGVPSAPDVMSPECFQVESQCLLPPRDAIPVIFLPGLMASYLRMKDGSDCWNAPSSRWDEIKELERGRRLTPADRQIIFDTENTVVFATKEFVLPTDIYTLNREEAERRGWGLPHYGTYFSMLVALEKGLNSRYDLPPGNEKRTLQDTWGTLLCLGIKDKQTHADVKSGLFWKQNADARKRYVKDADKISQIWSETPPPLTDAELEHCKQFYFPVWGFGYNWLRCNSDSAEKLVKYITEVVLPRYDNSYFRHQGKVILVTHSMGGLVGRRAAQLAPDKILGVVHGVCPIAGAPVLYRRFRAGTEYSEFFGFPTSIGEWGFAVVAGHNASRAVPSMAYSPGPLELAPTKNYPMNWLRFIHTSLTGNVTKITSLPKADPYEEIYKKTTDECWWGMLDPELLDPTGLIREKGDNPVKNARDAIDKAKAYHDTLGHYIHPNTYSFYGNDEDIKAYGYVLWNTMHAGKLPDNLLELKDEVRTDKGTSWLKDGEYKGPTVPEMTPTQDDGRIRFHLVRESNQAGDGTVPEDSGRFMGALKPRLVLAIPGYSHNDSYTPKKSPYSAYAVFYEIAKITQVAVAKDG